MDYNMWLTFMAYAVVTALSPGPNNILALNATAMNGLHQSRTLLAGIYAGFLGVMSFSCLISVSVITLIPVTLAYVKYLGAAYILWLAYQVAVSKPATPTASENVQSFWKGFCLQFVNVKIILWAITAFTGFILPNYESPLAIIGFVILLAIIGNTATHIWAVAGSTFSTFLTKHWKLANYSMAVLLIYSAASLVM